MAANLSLLTNHSSLLNPVALVIEQPFLAPQPTAVSAKRAVSADHAMTRNDDADHVCAVRTTNRPASVFVSQAFRHPRIRASLPFGNRLQDFPGPQLERRTNRCELNIELEVFAGEVIGQLRPDCFQMLMFSRHYVCS